MRAVVDASIAIAWFADEIVPEHVLELLDEIANDRAVAPPLFRLEVANVFLALERRRKLAPETRRAMMMDLSKLPIQIDAESIEQTWPKSLNLAERFQLTMYDATYLELAQRMKLPLATLDAALIRASAQCGVEIA
jgi:predicted nucleic acid-binding protein